MARLRKIETDPRVTRIGDICDIITSGFTPKVANLIDGDVAFVTVECVSPLQLDSSKFKRIPEADYRAGFVGRRKVTKGSILCTIKRRIGQAYPFLDHPDQPLAINQDVALLRPKPGSVTPAYLAAYLGSAIGQAFANREQTEQMNPYLSLIGLRNLPVIVASENVQAGIEELLRAADALSVDVKSAMLEAEATLLTALGLAAWSPPEPLSYTARAAEAFSAARLDAQYFRPKYSEAIALLHAKGNAVELGKLVKLNSRGRQPIYADAGLPVINSKHVRTNHVNLNDDNRFGEVDKSPVVIKNGDVLLNGTGVGTIGRAAPYVFEHDALPDNHVTVIRPDQIDPIYLSVFLNSTLGQLQIEQLIKGSSGQIELYPDDIAKITVWDAPSDVQTSVRDSLLSAKALEIRSRALLNAAKRAVEIAIEESEEAALAYLASAGGATNG